MPEAARFSLDACDGKCPANVPDTAITASPNVAVNSQAALRRGDTFKPHSAIVPHIGRKIAVGSSTVSVNGRPMARKGDAIDCGAKIATGSSNVFVGG